MQEVGSPSTVGKYSQSARAIWNVTRSPLRFAVREQDNSEVGWGVTVKKTSGLRVAVGCIFAVGGMFAAIAKFETSAVG